MCRCTVGPTGVRLGSDAGTAGVTSHPPSYNWPTCHPSHLDTKASNPTFPHVSADVGLMFSQDKLNLEEEA